MARAAQEQLVPGKAAGRRTRVGCGWLAAPRCGSSRRLAPLHHVWPAGALRARVARAGGRISGTAGRTGPPGPETLLPEVPDISFPASPSPGRGNHQGPGQALRRRRVVVAGGLRGPAPSHLPGLHLFIHLGRRVEAPTAPPAPRAFSPALCRARLLRCRKLICDL